MAAAEQFSLRWNNFQSNMTSGFHSLWEGEDLVDVTLAADGRFLQAHKVVLSVCSPYFKTLFKVNPCKHPIVILKDVGYKDLEALLQFMYRGEVNVCQEELPSFLKTAEMLEVKGLTGEESQKDNSPSQPAPTSKLKERVHLSQESSGNAGSPIKRKRTACPVSPIVIGDEPSSRGSHGDYSELAQPKVEPTDVEGEDGEHYNTDKDASESLATLLGGESSHGGMHGDSIQGMDASMFSNLSSHQVQDSGGSGGPQDGSQGGGSDKRQSTPADATSIPQTSIYRHTLSILNSSRGVGILKKNISNQLWRGARTTATEYRCTLCQKTFTRRDHLRTHERNLHGQDAGPFTCVICMQLYKNADSLRKHVTKYHYSRESASSTVTDVPS